MKKDFPNIDFKPYDDQTHSVLYSLDIACGVAHGSSLAMGFEWEDHFGRNRRQRSWYASILQISNIYLMPI